MVDFQEYTKSESKGNLSKLPLMMITKISLDAKEETLEQEF